nr:replication protein B [Mute swan feces associated circular virus 16]
MEDDWTVPEGHLYGEPSGWEDLDGLRLAHLEDAARLDAPVPDHGQRDLPFDWPEALPGLPRILEEEAWFGDGFGLSCDLPPPDLLPLRDFGRDCGAEREVLQGLQPGRHPEGGNPERVLRVGPTEGGPRPSKRSRADVPGGQGGRHRRRARRDGSRPLVRAPQGPRGVPCPDGEEARLADGAHLPLGPDPHRQVRSGSTLQPGVSRLDRHLPQRLQWVFGDSSVRRLRVGEDVPQAVAQDHGSLLDGHQCQERLQELRPPPAHLHLQRRSQDLVAYCTCCDPRSCSCSDGRVRQDDPPHPCPAVGSTASLRLLRPTSWEACPCLGCSLWCREAFD